MESMADTVVYPISISPFLIVEFDFFKTRTAVCSDKNIYFLKIPFIFYMASDLVLANEKSNRGGLQKR